MNTMKSFFRFSWKSAPFNSFELAATSSLVYVFLVLAYVYIPGAKAIFLIKNTRPLVSIHNIILCFGSLIMFVGCAYEVVKRSSIDGVEWIVCENPTTEAEGMLWLWSYIYYLSKFYELADTFLQFLSGKTPPNFFLHVYHHSCVIIMSWAWIHYQASPQFVGILMNTAVHVVMYYYFYLKSIGVSPKWKSYVTKFQIIQFVLSLVIISITLGYALQRREDTPEYPQCKGIHVVLGSLLFNSTLLYGFIKVLGNSANQSKMSKSE